MMRRVAETLRRTWPVLLSYGALSMWGVGFFVLSIVLSSGGGDPLALVGIIVSVLIGHVLGNVVGMLGVRGAIVLLGFAGLFVLALMSTAAIGPAAIFVIVGLFAGVGGYLGIASRLDILAGWFPLSFSVGAALVWLNSKKETLGTFESGSKHAIWDTFSLVSVAGGIVLFLLFLTTRHALALTLWQTARAADGATVQNARPGRGSLFALLGFAVLLTLSNAILSPYLFRTKGEPGKEQESAPRKERPPPKENPGCGKQKEGEQKEPAPPKKKRQGCGKEEEDKDPKVPEPDTERAVEDGGRALLGGMQILAWMFALGLVLLVLLAIAFQPVRRAVFLRHLVRPLWPVPPTRRVRNLWRRAEIVLSDLGQAHQPGEPPLAHADRAALALRQEFGEMEELRSAAAILEKVEYAGRGLGAEEEGKVKELILAFLGNVTRQMGLMRRIASAWKPIDNGESE